jgi:hypothetical protein
MTVPSQPFSERFGVRPTPPARLPDEVPESARVRLAALIDKLRNKYLPGAYSLGTRLAEAVGRRPEGSGDMSQIRGLIYGLDWWEFYDVAEELLRLTGSPEDVAVEVDGLFSSEGLPYAMTPSGIQWRFSEPAGEAVQEARRLLVDEERLRGPAQQWDKALGHLAQRPPDAENCIKDAVGALEGLARIISGHPSNTLGQIVKPLADQLGVHGALASAISSLYGYRGDEQAIAHGATQPLANIIPEAELVSHWAAAAIVYLVKRERQR